MDGKTRIRRAIRHQSVDRIPIDIGGTGVTGMHVSCVANLRKHYGLENRPVMVHEPYQMLGWIDDDLRDAMGVDTTGIMPFKTMFGFRNDGWREWRCPWGQVVLVPAGFNPTETVTAVYLHPEGDRCVPPSGHMPKSGYFFDTIIRQEPIDESKLDPKDNLEEFGDISDDALRHIDAELRRVESAKKAVIGGIGGTGLGDIALVPAPFLKHPKGIRDVAEWYVSTLARTDYVHAVFSAQVDVAIRNLVRYKKVVGDRIDVLFVCGTDFGTQDSSFCSVDTFVELYQPYYQRINDWVHRNTDWMTFKHSCGAVSEFIPSFLDAGFDILNPVQCSAAGMDPGALKDEFGSYLTFWGGGVDTQNTLPFGTPADVKAEVTERCDVLGEYSGFVFNTIHNIQARTPVANIVAMLDAVHNFGKAGG